MIAELIISAVVVWNIAWLVYVGWKEIEYSYLQNCVGVVPKHSIWSWLNGVSP